MNILEKITERTKERIAEEKKKVPFVELRRQAETLAASEARNASEALAASEDLKRSKAPSEEGNGSGAGRNRIGFKEALKREGLSLICEVKRASPSKGLIAQDFPYLEIAGEYEEAGAAAISCLTEPYWFLGSDEYLREIVKHVSIPVLRKDFTCDPYMVYQAKTLGASAILLICAVLDDGELGEYFRLAKELGLDALVETHSYEEIERAQKIGADIIGVNNRNLKDFTVDIDNSIRLRKLVSSDTVFVSESGIRGAEDMRKLYENGTDAVLIGEMLMRAPDRKKALRALSAPGALEKSGSKENTV